MIETRPVFVHLREDKPRRNELLSIVWERLDGVRKTSVWDTTVRVYLEDPLGGASQAASILHEYLPLIQSITDDNTWDKCTMVSYETPGPEKVYDTGIPLDEFDTFGNLIVEVSELLSEETGYPALYFLLLELVYRGYMSDIVYSMTDRIPAVSEESHSFSFRLPFEGDASDYYNLLGNYIMKHELEMYDSFLTAADLVLKKGDMDHQKLLSIASAVTRVSGN